MEIALVMLTILIAIISLSSVIFLFLKRRHETGEVVYDVSFTCVDNGLYQTTSMRMALNRRIVDMSDLRKIEKNIEACCQVSDVSIYELRRIRNDLPEV